MRPLSSSEGTVILLCFYLTIYYNYYIFFILNRNKSNTVIKENVDHPFNYSIEFPSFNILILCGGIYASSFDCVTSLSIYPIGIESNY